MLKKFKNQKGFTLIEMMIVMLIISVLLIITIPNITKHNSNINEKGCQAFVKMVQAQVQAYEMEKKKMPTSVEDLVAADYLKEDAKGCPDGKTKVEIQADGKVVAVANTSE
ncbi:prepilin-type N-terminal cleavage/methylation domain-containing protein [Bacillus salipaludis]|uniref:ComG operon protein 3 n=1 Tax=Bacillus salipaludis TaxID=2547811 RepID=A0A4R5VP83_9BACI|nr:competence type IV pilus major pilin ComGC [Bacillus salipaludis]MDQ6599637.1 competence type IV pilus major pilin ComGC [Bacillus salipaludis]TDK60095.1 prepilin-type N-terminal cleavage/methylation domain-containing protein [Bacillus salipaludis]